MRLTRRELPLQFTETGTVKARIHIPLAIKQEVALVTQGP